MYTLRVDSISLSSELRKENKKKSIAWKCDWTKKFLINLPNWYLNQIFVTEFLKVSTKVLRLSFKNKKEWSKVENPAGISCRLN